MLGQHRMMQVGAPVPHPDGHCGRDAAGHRAAKIAEAGRIGQLVTADLGKHDRVERQEEECDAKTLQEAWRGELQKRRIRIQRGSPEYCSAEYHEREAHREAQVHPVHVLADDRGHDQREQSHGRHREPRMRCGIAQRGLQPQRKEDVYAHHAEIAETEHDRRNPEVAALEQRQVNDRMLVGQLPGHEKHQADQGDDGGGDNDR